MVWSVWLFRNDSIFNRKMVDILQLIDCIKVRIAMWAKAKWPDKVGSINDAVRFPSLVMVEDKGRDQGDVGKWDKPQQGSMKFNVDGSARGQPGKAGIGGVLRDESGSIMLVFSKSIGIADSNMAELLTIKEAFLIFCALENLSSKRLIIESDSSNAVLWVSKPNSCPWRLRKFIMQMEGLKVKIAAWTIVHIKREKNDFVDGLAKAGVEQQNNLIVLY